MMLESGKEYLVEIVDIGQDGEGIGKAEGVTVFVENVVIGDLCRVKIEKVKKNYAFGKMVEIERPSSERIQSLCQYAGDCGGCSLTEINYETQLMLKEKKIRDSLERIGGIQKPKVLPILGMENPFYYRNNAQFPIGKNAVGFYRKKTHEVVDCQDCLLQSEPAVEIAQVIREYMKEYGIRSYHEKTGQGLLRHLIVRTAEGSGEIMVILVIRQGKLPDEEELIQWLYEVVDSLDINPETGLKWKLKSVVVNVNKYKSMVMGEKNIVIFGDGRITDRFCGLDFLISPRSFYQVNTQQMRKLYEKVKEYANLTGKETVFDFYCGVGTIGLFLSDQADKVIGIESLKDAIEDANRNAIRNEIVNTAFFCGKAEDILPEMIEKGEHVDVVVLDPPRKGCEETLLQTIADAKVKKIIYVSCNPATLARDIKYLTARGYALSEVQPVDMFPWTVHVETVVLLQRR